MKQFGELGKDAYKALGKVKREVHIFEQLMKQKNVLKLTEREVRHATDYVNDVLRRNGLPPVK